MSTAVNQSDEVPVINPCIRVELGHGRGCINIPRRDGCGDWVEAERQAWLPIIECLRERFVSLPDRKTSLLSVESKVSNHFNGLTSMAARVVNSQNQETLEQFKNELMLRYDSQGTIPLSDSKQFGVLRSHMEVDPTLVLGMLMGMWETGSSANEVGLVMRAMTHLTLLTDFGAEPNEWIANADRVIDHRMTRTRDLEDRFEGIVKQNDAAHQKFSEFLVQSSGQWDGKCKEFDTKRHEIEDLYHKKLATHAAVAYWGNRGKVQRIQQFIWLGLFVGIAAGVLFWVNRLSSDMKPIETVTGATTGNVVLLIAQLVQSPLGLRILIIAFGIWICRLCVRNYLSARHHLTDAEERVAMIETYLAMLQDETISKNEELRKMTLPAVLQVIFRHTQDGYVKDDAIPLNSISIGGNKSS